MKLKLHYSIPLEIIMLLHKLSFFYRSQKFGRKPWTIVRDSYFHHIFMLFNFTTQFPVLLVLMLIIVLYGLVQPFTGKAGTALEAFLSVATLLLLLLRNTRQATDTLGLKEIALPDSQGEQECVESVERTARLTWLLFPLYYIPLVTLIVAVCWWTINRLWYVCVYVYIKL